MRVWAVVFRGAHRRTHSFASKVQTFLQKKIAAPPVSSPLEEVASAYADGALAFSVLKIRGKSVWTGQMLASAAAAIFLLNNVAAANESNSNVHRFSCAEGYQGYLCKSGNNSTQQCTNSSGNTVDNLKVSGVATGTVINFNFSYSGTQDPTKVQVKGTASQTGNPTPMSGEVPPDLSMSYTVTPADAEDGESDFQVALKTNPDKQLKAAANYTVSCAPQTATAKVTVVKKVKGGSGAFNFTGSLGDFSLNAAPDNNGQKSFDSTPLGQTTISETVPSGWTLTSRECKTKGGALVGGASGDAGVQFTLNEGDDITCTFTNFKPKDDEPTDDKPKDEKMGDVTKVYLHRRVDNLLSEGPDRSRLIRRLEEQRRERSLKDGGAPIALQGGGDAGDVKFSTSLSGMRAAAAAEAAAKEKEGGYGFDDSPYHYLSLTHPQRPRFDIWAEGHLKNYTDVTGGLDRDGAFRMMHLGADYAVTSYLLVGGLLQYDYTNETLNNADLKGVVKGSGWMVGPYIGLMVTDHLFFDARGAWGQSSNDINLTDNDFGYRTGAFNTDRWLATANLTGNWRFGAWRLSPRVGLGYGNESQDVYRTSLGQMVDANNITMGRLTFGPEIGYRIVTSGGTVVEPHVAVEGVRNFNDPVLYLSTGPVSPEELRAKVEGGVLVRLPDGVSARAAGAYDGIGDKNMEAWSAKVWLSLPLK
jgi:hypothetical protein